MKLATLRNGARDGMLAVVSRDLTRYVAAEPVAPTLQAALDNWASVAPKLHALARDLEIGAAPSFRFREHEALSPLPRAYQWADGSAYVNHVELVRRARGVEMPASFWTDPLMYQGGSDAFLAPREPIVMASEDSRDRPRGGGRRRRRRRSRGMLARGRGGGDPARHARQRRVAAQSHPG